MSLRVVVTGGGGFIGAHLVRALVHRGDDVVVIENMLRGDQSRFADVAGSVELFTSDVRDEDAVTKACKGADVMFHLAAINGTENFYTRPELVLDVGLRGALAVMNGCRTAGVGHVIVASSAEVYQTPDRVPTAEDVPLMLPDSLNPRYSYGGSKIVSELIAFNYGREAFDKVQVFRPHNVYGPNMGWKHVLPQFIVRALETPPSSDGTVPFPIQGDGRETRAFAYVDDVVSGIMRMQTHGGHREIYHIGNDHEVSIRELVGVVGQELGLDLEIQPGEAAAGATPRRCPDIAKMRAIGYDPAVSLREGVGRTAKWYRENLSNRPDNALM